MLSKAKDASSTESTNITSSSTYASSWSNDAVIDLENWSCEGNSYYEDILTNCKGLHYTLNIMHWYVKDSDVSGYKYGLVGNTPNFNLFVTATDNKPACTYVGIVSGHNNHARVCCGNFQNTWTDSSSQMTEREKNWGKKLTDAAKCLNVPFLSEFYAVSMGKFTGNK